VFTLIYIILKVGTVYAYLLMIALLFVTDECRLSLIN